MNPTPTTNCQTPESKGQHRWMHSSSLPNRIVFCEHCLIRHDLGEPDPEPEAKKKKGKDK